MLWKIKSKLLGVRVVSRVLFMLFRAEELFKYR